MSSNIISKFNNLSDDEKMNTLKLIFDNQRYIFTEIFSECASDGYICKECNIFSIDVPFDIIPDLCVICFRELYNEHRRNVYKYYICVSCAGNKENLNCCICNNTEIIDADLLRSTGYYFD